jgi:hypothetical protein
MTRASGRRTTREASGIHAIKGVCHMAMRRLRVYTGPEQEQHSGSAVLDQPADNSVRVALGDVLPLLADAFVSNRTWLTDFKDDEISISSDLHDVLQAYRHFRRPGA